MNPVSFFRLVVAFVVSLQAVCIAAGNEYGGGKSQGFVQVAAGSILPHPLQPFAFGIGGPVNFALKLPSGQPAPIVPVLVGGEFEKELSFSSKAAMDAVFPAGTYQILAPAIAPLPINLSENYPIATPQVTQVTNGNGTWTPGGVLVLDPTQSTTITFTEFADYAAPGATGYMNPRVWGFTEQQDMAAVEIVSQPLGNLAVQATPVTSITIPAGTLTNDRIYGGTIDFQRIPTFDTSTVPGAAAYSVFEKLLRFYIAAQTNSTPASPPVVVTSPAARTAAAGGSTTFTASVTVPEPGRGNIARWFKDGFEFDTAQSRVVRSADGQTLTINFLTPADAGDYVLEIVNAGGVVRTVPATLTVTEPGLAQNASLGLGPVVQAGSVVDMQMFTYATPPVNVQWRKNGVDIPDTGLTVPDAAGIAHYPLLGAKPSDMAEYTAVASNAAGTTSPAPMHHARFIVDASGWRVRHGVPTFRSLTRIAKLGDREEFALTAGGGYFGISSDGVAWAQQPTYTSSTVSGYTYGNGRHVVHGASAFAVYVGSETTPRLSYLPRLEFNDPVAFGAGLFAAFTTTGRIYTSPDALSWTERTSGVTTPFVAAAHGGAGFAAVTRAGVDQIVRSSDGLAWQPPITAPFNGVSGLSFANDRYFLGGADGRLASSINAATWNTLTSGVDTAINHVAYANGLYVLVADGGKIATSTDGVTWTANTSITWGPAPNPVNVDLLNAAYANNRWCIVGSNGGNNTSALLTSTDNGATWVNQMSIASTATLNGIATDGTSMIAVGGGGTVLRSTNGSTWSRITPNPAGTVALNAVTHHAGAYYLVGAPISGAATVRSSPDGLAWTTLTTGNGNGLQWVGVLNGLLHVAGGNGTLLRYSGTGTTSASWTALNPGGGSVLNGAAFGNVPINSTPTDVYVAVGAAGTIRRSVNGTWSGVTSGTTANLHEVAFGNGRFVAVGDSGTILSSPDGETWTPRGYNIPANFVHVSFTQGLFVVSGFNNGLFTSANGEDWTARLVGTAGPRAVTVFDPAGDEPLSMFAITNSGGILSAPLRPEIGLTPLPATVAVGSTARLNVTPVSSALGHSFQWRKNGSPIGGATHSALEFVNAQTSDSGSYDVVITNAAGDVTSAPAALQVQQTPVAIAVQPAPTKYALVGSEAAWSIEASGVPAPAYQWRRNGVDIPGATQATYTRPAVQLADVGVYDVVVTNTAGSVTSAPSRLLVTPAANDTFPNFAWRAPVPNGGTFQAIAHDGTKFVASGVGGRVLTSTDGTAWAGAPASIPTEVVMALVYDGANFYATGGGGRIFRSTDLSSWTVVRDYGPNWMNGLVYADGKYVAVGGNGEIVSSINGTAWTSVNAPGNVWLQSVAGTTGRFVAVGQNGAIVTATDPAGTWSTVTPPAGHANSQFNDVAFVNGRFVAVGGSGAVISSTDGLTWSSHNTSHFDWLQRVVHDGTNYVVFASGDGVLRSTDLATWTRSTLPMAAGFAGGMFDAAAGGGVVAAVGAGGEIYTAAVNSTNWISRGSQGAVQRIATLELSDDLLVGVGAAGTIMTSLDGANWSREFTGTGHWFSAFAKGSNRAIAATGFGFIVSTIDGRVWTEHSVGDNTENLGATFGQGQFVVVGRNGKIRRSTDGTNWSNVTTPITSTLQSVAVLGNRFIAVGDGGKIFTSDNVTTWTERPSGTNETLWRVRVIDGVAFALGNNRTLLLSTNGETWLPVTVPNDYNAYGYSFRDIARLHDGYYIASSQGRLVRTPDFVQWSALPALAAGESLNAVVRAHGRVVIAGDGGALLSSTLPAAGAAPVIAVQPRPTLFIVGGSVVLSVVANSSEPLTYQWKKGASAIPGATQAVLVLGNLQSGDAGDYSVEVSNGTTTVSSSVAPLAVGTAPTIAQHPAHGTVVNGGTVTLSVTPSGSAPFRFQWKRHGNDLPGATSQSLTLTNLQPADHGNYSVAVANDIGAVTSNPGNLVAAVTDAAFAFDGSFARPQFRRAVIPARTTYGPVSNKLYASWVNGDFISAANDQRRGAVVRLNLDGTVDTSFNLGAFLSDALAVIEQPDGRVLVAGVVPREDSETGLELHRIFRFHADGTPDPTYRSPVLIRPARYLAWQGEKLLVALSVAAGGSNGGVAHPFFRLNADGSLDGTFTPPTFNLTTGVFANIVVDDQQRIYIGGTFNLVNGTARAGVARLLPDGALDTTYVPGGYTATGGYQVRGIGLQKVGANAGKLIVAGGTLNVSGIVRPVIRLGSNGALDTGFTLLANSDLGLGSGQRPRLVNLLDDDRFFIVSSRVVRLTADGAVDPTFTAPQLSAEAFWIETQPNGTVILNPEIGTSINGTPRSTLARFTTSGALDATFTPPQFQSEVYPGDAALLATGQFLVWGQFQSVNGSERRGLVRFNANGTVDGSFNLAGIDNLFGVTAVAQLPDGGLLAATQTGASAASGLQGGIVKLTAAGAIDGSFVPAAEVATAASRGGFGLILQGDKPVVWSQNAQRVVEGSLYVKRLLPGGAVDATFAIPDVNVGAVFRDGAQNITSITLGRFQILGVYPDGRLLAAVTDGDYVLNPANFEHSLVRLLPNGAVDESFTPPNVLLPANSAFVSVTDPVKANAVVQVPLTSAGPGPFAGVVPLADGSAIVYGAFTALGATPAPGIARLTAGGAVDATFSVGSGAELRSQPGRSALISGVTIAGDGKFWITGNFDTFGGRAAPGIVRLHANGTVDLGFGSAAGYQTYLGTGTKVLLRGNHDALLFGTYRTGNDSFPFAVHRLAAVAAPSILEQPAAHEIVAAGGSVTLRVGASGGPFPSLQWRKNGTDIAGATGTSYTIVNAGPGDGGLYTVVLSNGNGAPVTSQPAIVTVPAAGGDTYPEFAWRNPSPAGGTLRSVAVGGGKFVAVGTGGRMLVSNDGSTWSNAASGVTNPLQGVAYTGSGFVAVGSSGTILLSDAAATTWTKQTTNFFSQLNAVTVVGTRFVGVGYGQAFTSDGGANWTLVNIAGSPTLLGVAGTAGNFVAVGPNGTILKSTDGTSWTAVTPPTGYATAEFLNVRHLNGQFIIVGGNGVVLVSSDGGTTWSPRDTGNGYWYRDVAYNGAAYLVATDTGRVVRSEDLTTWTAIDMPTFAPHLAVVANGTVFVAVGGGGEIWRSNGGTQWTSRGFVGGTWRLGDVGYHNGRFVAVGSQGSIYTSADGNAWSRTGGNGPWAEAIAYGLGLYVVPSTFGDIRTSPDGRTWTNWTVGDNVSNHGAAFGNGVFVVVGMNGKIRTSTNGTTWSNVVVAGLTDHLQSVAFNNGMFVAAGANGKILSSPNGTTWTAQSVTPATNAYLRRVRVVDGAFFIVGDNRTLLVSPNGTTWTPLPVDQQQGYSYRDIVRLPDSYAIVGNDGLVLTSADLRSWTLGSLVGAGENLNGVAIGGGRVVVVGEGGTILSSALPATTATPAIAMQPAAQTIANIQNVILSVVANANGPMTYQWRKGGVNISGATGSVLVLPNAQIADSGAYSVVVTGPTGVSVTSNTAQVDIGPKSSLVALSARQAVPVAGDLWAYFTVEGATPKPVILRAAGPALAAAPFNLANTLADPKLELHRLSDQTKVAENDDWSSTLSTAFQQVGAFAWTTGSKDAALAATVPAGTYGVRVSGVNGTGGEVLVEVYDQSSATPRLAHLALRVASVGGTAGTLTGGFSVAGNVPRQLLIRAVGPAIGGAPNPLLALFNSSSTQIATNDNWGNTAGQPAIVAAQAKVGASPFADGSLDAALLVTLNPGSYTAQVSTSGSSAPGAALLEIHEVDDFRGNVPPAILSPVAAQTLTQGTTLTLGSYVVAKPGATFTWSKDGTPLGGQTSSTLTIANAQPTATGSYVLTVTNAAGTATATFPVTINPATTPVITALPIVAQAVTGTTNVSVTATGSAPLTYQWYAGNSPSTTTPGSTNASFTTPVLTQSLKHWVRVTNVAGQSVNSATVPVLAFAPRNPPLTTTSLNALAFGNGTYVAAGFSNVILTSPDGESWTRRSGIVGMSLRGAAFGANRFVVVGDSGTTAPRISYSNDNGQSWIATVNPTGGQLNGVYFNGSLFVAVGNGSTVLSSSDGIAWTPGTLGTANVNLRAVTFAGSTWVAVGENGAVFTWDGAAATWTSRSSGTAAQLNAVVGDGTRFVAAGNGGVVIFSSDATGSAWSSALSGTTTNLNAAVFAGGRFLAAGGTTQLSSTDGQTWAVDGFVGGNGGVNALLFANSLYVSAGFPGAIFTSATGAVNSWTIRHGGSTRTLLDAVYGDARYVAVGLNGAIAHSTDGVAWTFLDPAVPGVTNNLRRIVYARGLYVAVGDFGRILVSDNGTNWTTFTVGSGSYLAATYAAGRFIAAGTNGATVTSVDGFNWVAGPTVGSSNITGLDVGGGAIVAVNAAGGIFSSPDGVVWTARTSGVSTALNNVVFANGQFIAVGANSVVLTSPNGATWTPRAVPTAGLTFNDVAHGDGVYLLTQTFATFSGGNNGALLHASRDGATWNTTIPGGGLVSQTSLAGITFGNGTFLFVAAGGVISQTVPAIDTLRITAQPAGNPSVTNGQTVALSVTAQNATSYQWYEGASGDISAPIGGATTASYTTPPLFQSRRYWVRAFGAGGASVDSATALLLGAPAIVAALLAQNANDGGRVVLTANALGAAPLSYQWLRNGVAIDGATNASLTLDPIRLDQAGSYSVRVSNALAPGGVTSSPANIAVTPVGPALGPVSSTFGANVPVGSNAYLEVQILAGTQPLSYQWRFNGANIPGATNAHHFITDAQTTHSGNYSVVVTNNQGSSTSGAFNLTVAPELGWISRNPLPSANGLSSVLFANGKFLVGGLRSTLLESTDGLTWTPRAVPGAGNLFGLLYAGGQYVGLAGVSAVYTSPDGVVWTRRDAKVTDISQLNAVAYGNGLYLAGGAAGRTTRSTDGVTWTLGSVPTTDALWAVEYLGDRFFVGTNAGKIFTSLDGVSWTQRTTPAGRTDPINGIAVLGGAHVATSGRDFLTSSDGNTWTVQNAGLTFANDTSTLTSVRLVNNQLVALGSAGEVFTSANGTTWTSASSGATSNLREVDFGNGIYVAAGQSGRALLTSTDLTTWQNRVTGPSQSSHVRHVAASPTRVVAINAAGTALHSTDGFLWSESSIGFAGINDFVYGGGAFIAVGNGGLVLRTEDGATWSQRTSGTNLNLRGVKYGDGRFTAVSDGGTVISSTDGLAWTVATTAGGSFWNVTFGAGRLVAVGNNGGVFHSTNQGATWTTGSGAGIATTGYSDVVFGNGRFVAVGLGGVAATSTDGVTWTHVPPFVTSDVNLNNLNFVGGSFIVAGTGSTYYVSTNGTNWTPRYTGAFDRLNDFAVRGNEIFGVGNNGTILSAGIPVIVAQPQPVAARAGATVTLRALAAASPVTVTYQWQKDTTDIPGATSPTLTLSSITTASAGAYRLVATNTLGSVTSDPATLTVSLAPTFTSHPQNLIRIAGETAIFTATAAGTPAPTYRWQKDGVDLVDGPGIAGSGTSTLTLTNVQSGSAGAYRAVATNTPVSETVPVSDTSLPATLTVNVPATPVISPAGTTTVVAGGGATFDVASASGTTPIAYQWRLNGLNIPGATNAQLQLSNLTLTSGGSVTVVATNATGAVTSAAATLVVNPPAPVIQSPATANGMVGANFTFAISTNTQATFSFTGTLPAGLTFNTTTGVITGVPTTAGSSPIQVTATNITNSDTKPLQIDIAAPPPVVTSPAAVAGRVGQALNYTIVATNSPATFDATNLPPGYTRTGATLSGPPTQAGTFTTTVSATNASGTGSLPVVFTIQPALNAPSYTGTTTQPSGTQNTAFSFVPTFANSAGATYAITAGTLPANLNLNPTTGEISGNPAEVGTFNITLTATGAGGSASVALTIVINPPANAPTIVSVTNVVATVGVPFNFLLETDVPATEFLAPGLPVAGLSLTANSGLISGTPNAPGTLQLQVAARNGTGTGPTSILVINVNPSPSAPVISSSPVVEGRVGVVTTVDAPLLQLAASNAPESFVITSGTMPPGLNAPDAAGNIFGNPSTVGDTRVWFAAENTAGGRGPALEVLFSIKPALNVPVVTSNGTAAGQVGQLFSYVIMGTNSPTSYGATGSPMPAWLSRNGAVLSGVPTSATVQPIAIDVTASNGDGASAPKRVLISIAPAPATPVITSAATAPGRVGLVFTYQITASDSPTSFVATNLPPGLEVNPTTGQITGTPTQAGTFTASLSAGNVAGLGTAFPLTLTIAPAPQAPAITSAPTANGKVGVAFSYPIVATNGPITNYRVTGTLPLGVSLNTTTGVIAGTPAEPGSFLVSLTATSASGTSLPQPLSISINPADNVPVITSGIYALATAGADFSYMITATNMPGSTPYSPPVALDAVNLPPGLAVNPATGLIVGRPTASGIFMATLVGTNVAGQGPFRDLTIFVLPAASAPVITSNTTAPAQVGVAFNYQITATNAPVGFDVLNAPAWMTINGQSGALGGSPTAPGLFTMQLVASNSAGASSPVSLTLSVAPAANTPVVVSSRSENAQVGAPFSYTIVTSPVSTSFLASGVPPGLTFNSGTGTIAGTPTSSGTFDITISGVNANGQGQPVTLRLTISPNVTFVIPNP